MIILNNIQYRTTKEVAELLGVKPRTVSHYVKLKKLTPFRPTPGKTLFTDEQIQKFLQGS